MCDRPALRRGRGEGRASGEMIETSIAFSTPIVCCAKY
ncbi:hypothetical protein ACVW17_002710 [Bradyrhizobium sp. USDA 4473]